MLEQQRYGELDSVLKKHNYFAFRWCEAENWCACLGCVNVACRKYFLEAGIEPPTYVEWLEYTNQRMKEMLFDLGVILE